MEARMSTTANTKDLDENDNINRGDNMLELVRKIPSHGINKYHFNDMSDFDINVFPIDIWNELNNFNADMYEG